MRRFTCLALSCVFLCTGCYSTQIIRPAQLPNLDSRRGGTVEGPDGHLVEVEGELNATVVDEREQRVTFRHPVRANLTNTTLSISAANQSKTDFDVERIRALEIESYDSSLTAGAIIGGGAVLAIAAIIVTAVLLSNVDSNSELNGVE